jgi:hypothetical protein
LTLLDLFDKVTPQEIINLNSLLLLSKLQLEVSKSQTSEVVLVTEVHRIDARNERSFSKRSKIVSRGGRCCADVDGISTCNIEQESIEWGVASDICWCHAKRDMAPRSRIKVDDEIPSSIPRKFRDPRQRVTWI